MERKFYEKYTSLKVPLTRFFLAPFLFPVHGGLTLQILFFLVGSLATSQKRKLLDEGLERKREEELKELYDGRTRPLNLGWIMALWEREGFGRTVFFSLHFLFFSDDAAMKDWVRGLEKDKEELSEKL
jgi:hypothetical protein